jgi:hypothetical protein
MEACDCTGETSEQKKRKRGSGVGNSGRGRAPLVSLGAVRLDLAGRASTSASREAGRYPCNSAVQCSACGGSEIHQRIPCRGGGAGPDLCAARLRRSCADSAPLCSAICTFLVRSEAGGG